MYVRQLKESNFLEYLKLSALCFDYPLDTGEKSGKEYVEYVRHSVEDKGLNDISMTMGAFNDMDELMSCLCLIPYEFYFDGSTVKGTGIGNVCTYPQHRRKGAVREMFITSLRAMYEGGSGFSYLYPFSESFYNMFGYSRISNSICYKWNLLSLPKDKFRGNFYLYGNNADEKDFDIAYQRFASKYNLMVKRDHMDWRNLKEAKGSRNNNYAFLYKDESGEPRGYVILKGNRTESIPYISCKEFVFDSLETLKAILSFTSSYAADYRAVMFQAPSYLNIDGMCSDYTMEHITISKPNNGMARVVNADAVLKTAAYRGTGSFILELTDPYLKENEGLFKINYEDGRAVHVKHVNNSEPADAVMNIGLFSAAIVGNYETRDFEWLENCEIRCGYEKLSDVFYKKPCFINNYF